MRTLLKAIAFFGILAVSAPAFAQVSFDIRFGPPPPRREIIVTAPFPGAIWVPGYYAFDYGIHRYQWINGAWNRPPYEGARWIEPRYVRGGERYGFEAGHWMARGEDRGHFDSRGHWGERHDRDDRSFHDGRPFHDGRGRM
jgi:hypothetical protein